MNRTLAAASAVQRAAASGQAPAGNLVVPDRRPSVEQTEAIDPFREIGTSGLRQYGGFVLEEWLGQLHGRKAAWVYREMMDNSPIIGAVLYAIEWLARGVEWRVDQGKTAEAAELVESSMHDMSHTWGDFVCEALSMLPYGYSFHEIVYKRCNGQQPDWAPVLTDVTGYNGPDTSEDDSKPASSQYNDGKIRWRKLRGTAQETLLKWVFDGYSGLRAMHQLDYHGGSHIIPIQKALLFRARPRRNSPEGYSILRPAFTSYFSLKSIQQIEGIGIERDLAGIPVATPPPGVDLFSPGNAQLLAKVQQMVQSVRRDEYNGIVLPSAEWKFELLSTGGSRQINTDPVIRRYEQRMATAMLAEFVLIGQDSVGSYAMIDVKSDLFGMAIDGVLDLFCEVMNQRGIPRLLKLNGMDPTDGAKIAHGSAGRINLERVGSFLQAIALAGAPVPWSVQLLRSLFLEAGLPANFETHDKPETLPVVPQPVERHVIEPPGAEGSEPAQEAQDGPAKPQSDRGASNHNRTVNGPEKPVTKADRMQAANDAALAEIDEFMDALVAEEIAKAQTGAVDISGVLRRRHAILSAQLEREMHGALAELGSKAADAYAAHVGKADMAEIRALVTKVMRALNIEQWVRSRLQPLFRNHAGRVMADAQRTVQAEIRMEVQIGTEDAERIAQQSGADLRASDIEPQVREAIMQAIRAGQNVGENPTVIARRIREQVPAGRFVHAGSKYRANLIARDQTSRLLRDSVLSAYESNPRVTGVELRDGIFGPPRSDAVCIARDRQVVPIGEARSVHAEHTLCTLSMNPVIAGTRAA